MSEDVSESDNDASVMRGIRVKKTVMFINPKPS